MTTAIIIPARFESTRFRGKPLATINGKPMIQWVVEAASRSKLRDRIIVATDEKRIFDFVKEKLSVENKSLEVYITLPEHKCGTDRIGEVTRKFSDIEYVVNLQCDEPLMPPEYIDKVLEPLVTSVPSMVSLVTPITNLDDLTNPNIVKVVMDKDGYALYFSRSSIPYNRAQSSELKTYFRHIGIYAFRRESILRFCQLPQSSLEKLEQLEQLRALENGIKIKLKVVEKAYPAVDKVEDIEIVEKILQATQFTTV